MAKQKYTIAALWMEGPLSYLEQLCMKSFVDAGHHTVLYHYGPLANVPDGIELADANEILPQTNFLQHERTGSPALHSDLFRYKMLKKMRNTIWADTDAYCMKPFETPNGHFYGWESSKHINGGVLGLPHDSDTLNALLDFTSDEFAIPSYYGPEYEAELIAKRDAGDPVHASEQPWGVWGPHAVTHFLLETGESRFALPQEGLYPFTFKDRRFMLKRNFDTTPYITENTFSVHLYGRRMRARLGEAGEPPHPKSLIGKLLTKHGIDPAKAPIPRKPKKAEDGTIITPVTAVRPADKVGRGKLNLTDLADKYGTNKGGNKYRYSEAYQMIMQPHRNRAISLLELGLQDGGPERGAEPDRETTDAPSVRMWLEYFQKGEITGIDVSDFSWLKEDRFTFHQCDLADEAALDKTVDQLGEFDFIIDDASHASPHQQMAFLKLFPKVKSGGFYIIEGLRGQPRRFEPAKFTKTADLFESYLKDGIFRHSDTKISDQFNDLRLDISGVMLLPAFFMKVKQTNLMILQKR
ncbi:hypothetical protein [Donghicola sp.]|jgi:hypothetical protein|uniref:hypothetical protein n=1 Tax=Donghicola sp. TaxID=1929294 RepID=UPI0025E97D9A|nr:hypothetical protein [Donghicola sp.]MCT4578293.1 class I SAM-dependent methyltransferase [Donghicola sp.]